MAKMKTPTIRGSYGGGSVNQGPPKGPFEDRVVSRGGQSPLGNALARNVGPGGPGAGRDVYPSGSVMTHGPANPGNPPERPRSGDVMSNNRGPG
jgi:hypothetical protein